jgi:hypothetical protein
LRFPADPGWLAVKPIALAAALISALTGSPIEPSSSPEPAGLKDVDGLGEPPGLPAAATELAQAAPGLELGVGALTSAAQPGVRAVAGLLRFRPLTSRSKSASAIGTSSWSSKRAE